MKDYSGHRRAPWIQNYIPEFLDGYDYQYQIMQNHRNNSGMHGALQARVMEVIDLTSGQLDEMPFIIVAKTTLDEYIEDPVDLTKMRESTDLCLLDHFLPESSEIAATQRPEIGQLVNVYYKDPANKTGGIYTGFAKKFTLNNLKEDTYLQKDCLPSAKAAHSSNTNQNKATLGSKSTDSNVQKSSEEKQNILDTQISANYKLRELVVTSRVPIEENMPNDQEISKLKLLAEKILEPLISYYGRKPTINSCFRSEKVNKLVGGSQTSQHRTGEAVDLEFPGISNYELSTYISENLVFDQLILEFHQKEDPSSGWVHVSYRASPRLQLLTINSKTGNKFKGGLIV